MRLTKKHILSQLPEKTYMHEGFVGELPAEMIHNSIRSGEWDFEEFDEVYEEYESEVYFSNLDYYLAQLREDLAGDFPIDRVIAQTDKYIDEIREELELRDAGKSPFEKALRNTDPVAAYMKVYYVEDPFATDDPDDALAQMYEELGIAERTEELDKKLEELRTNSQGGNLCIMFNTTGEEFVNLSNGSDFFDLNDTPQTIEFFGDVHLCIMDRMNGSGHNVTINTPIVFPFDRSRLYVDSVAGGYSYTHEVIGEYSTIWDGTGIKIYKNENDTTTV
jgi:hypothetical protein